MELAYSSDEGVVAVFAEVMADGTGVGVLRGRSAECGECTRVSFLESGGAGVDLGLEWLLGNEAMSQLGVSGTPGYALEARRGSERQRALGISRARLIDALWQECKPAEVMLWAMFCWETLGPAIHVDVTVTHSTYLNIVTDHVHPFMETLFPDGCGLFQQDNAPCHKAEMVQEWFDDHNNQFEVLTPPPNSPDLNPIQHLWDVLENKSHPW
ncbi:hypothetical protein QTP86_015225, partial [Hemibagrus guttatus]